MCRPDTERMWARPETCIARQVAWSMPARTPGHQRRGHGPGRAGVLPSVIRRAIAGAQLRERQREAAGIARAAARPGPWRSPPHPAARTRPAARNRTPPGSAGPIGRCSRARTRIRSPGARPAGARRRLTRIVAGVASGATPSSVDPIEQHALAARQRRQVHDPALDRIDAGPGEDRRRDGVEPQPGPSAKPRQATASASSSASPTLGRTAPRPRPPAARSARPTPAASQPAQGGGSRGQGEQQRDPGPQRHRQPQEPAPALLLQHGAAGRRQPDASAGHAAADAPRRAQALLHPLPNCATRPPPSNTADEAKFQP